MSDLEAQVRYLADRQAILDCIYRYARGVDRDDMDLLTSAYHDDAVDDHGFYLGNARGLGEWVFDSHKDAPASQHHITNHYVEIDGDAAHAETYYIAINRAAEGKAGISTGRYIDRFERRDGRWAIAARTVVNESVLTADVDPLNEVALKSFAPFSRDRTDLSYERPLTTPKRSSLKEPHPPLTTRAD